MSHASPLESLFPHQGGLLLKSDSRQVPVKIKTILPLKALMSPLQINNRHWTTSSRKWTLYQSTFQCPKLLDQSSLRQQSEFSKKKPSGRTHSYTFVPIYGPKFKIQMAINHHWTQSTSEKLALHAPQTAQQIYSKIQTKCRPRGKRSFKRDRPTMLKWCMTDTTLRVALTMIHFWGRG